MDTMLDDVDLLGNTLPDKSKISDDVDSLRYLLLDKSKYQMMLIH